MSSKAHKLLERMRRSKAGWKRRDLDDLYLGFGFVIKPGANHDLVKHPDFPEIKPTSLPRHNKILEHYVVFAVKQIDRLLELQKAQEEQTGETEAVSSEVEDQEEVDDE